jgi:hypothetical protein
MESIDRLDVMGCKSSLLVGEGQVREAQSGLHGAVIDI